MPELRLEIMSRWGVMTLRIVMIRRFIPKKCPELLLGRVLQDGTLEIVDRIVEIGQYRKERVDKAVHDQVENANLWCGRGAAAFDEWWLPIRSRTVASAGQSPWWMLMMNLSVTKQCTSATFFPSPAMPKVTIWTKSS